MLIISQVYVSSTAAVSTKALTTEPFNPSKKESDTQVPLYLSLEISNLTSFIAAPQQHKLIQMK